MKHKEVSMAKYLNPCPCGKTPTKLLIYNTDRVKWQLCAGDCCNDWWVEFRSDYAEDQELYDLAYSAWNANPRRKDD